jgi:hypothetical protein
MKGNGMHTFKDGEGRDWSIHLTVGVLERIRREAGVNLMEVATGDLWQRLVDDPVLLVKVLASACVPAESRVAFADAMRGDAFDGGLAALARDILDFFPGLGRLKAAEKLRALMPAPTSPRIPGDSSGPSPAGSDATPATAP